MHGTSADSADSGPGFAVMLGAFADLGDRIDKVGPAVASSLSRTAKPVIRPLGIAMVATIANPDILALPDMPSPGRVWNVRKVGLFGSDGHSSVSTFSAASISNGGATVVPAGAGTVIATWTVAVGGTYSVSVNTQVTTSVAADHNNMGLFVNGVQNTILPVATAGQASEQSQPVNLVLNTGDVVTVRQIAVTTAAGYLAIITATPLTQSGTTGIADVYSGNDSELPDFSGQFLTGVSVPSITLIGKDRVRVKANEQVYALVYNVTAGQQLAMVCEIEEYRVQDVEAMSI